MITVKTTCVNIGCASLHLVKLGERKDSGDTAYILRDALLTQDNMPIMAENSVPIIQE